MPEANLIRRAPPTPPEANGGVIVWRSRRGDADVLFLGKGTPRERPAPLSVELVPPTVNRARLRQVHGATVRSARSGNCGDGDGLVAREPQLALEIATADCVPVLLCGPERVGAAHAGWRGIVAGIVAATLARLGEPRALSAWIGPAIGPCCYEVGEDVARAVVAASTPAARVQPSRAGSGRPHLDLALAAEEQLRAAGVLHISHFAVCTACHPEWLWSYRRDGAAAGRNLALIWRDS